VWKKIKEVGLGKGKRKHGLVKSSINCHILSRVCFDFLPFSVSRDFLKVFFSSQEFSKTKKLVKIMKEKIKTNSRTGQVILLFTNP
jgi:hypothetical protein